MEGNKNAMYAQAGRSRGWNQATPDNVTVKIPAPLQTPVVPPMNASSVMPPVIASPVMPPVNALPAMPPVIASPAMPPVNALPVMPLMNASPAMPPMPAPPITIATKLDKPANDCQTLAMAYIAMQKWQELCEPEQGFERGTLFSELDLPFVGEGACRYE